MIYPEQYSRPGQNTTGAWSWKGHEASQLKGDVVSETYIRFDLHVILVALVGSLPKWPANKLAPKLCQPLEETERERGASSWYWIEGFGCLQGGIIQQELHEILKAEPHVHFEAGNTQSYGFHSAMQGTLIIQVESSLGWRCAFFEPSLWCRCQPLCPCGYQGWDWATVWRTPGLQWVLSLCKVHRCCPKGLCGGTVEKCSQDQED